MYKVSILMDKEQLSVVCKHKHMLKIGAPPDSFVSFINRITWLIQHIHFPRGIDPFKQQVLFNQGFFFRNCREN